MALDEIRTALRSRNLLSFAYQGHVRTIVPMALGWDKNGAWLLRALQVGGGTSSGNLNPDAPRLFKVAEIAGATRLNTSFEIPAQYRRSDSAMVVIDTEL